MHSCYGGMAKASPGQETQNALRIQTSKRKLLWQAHSTKKGRPPCNPHAPPLHCTDPAQCGPPALPLATTVDTQPPRSVCRPLLTSSRSNPAFTARVVVLKPGNHVASSVVEPGVYFPLCHPLVVTSGKSLNQPPSICIFSSVR